MGTRLAINGFGRIGRLVLRAVVENKRDDIELVAINDSAPLETNAHLLRYDSVHGAAPFEINLKEKAFEIEGQRIQKISDRNPLNLPWKDLGVDLVLECTGAFRDRESAAYHLQAGARRVLVSAPCKQADKTIVYGVNHATLTERDEVVSCASCTTNALAPVAKVLDEAVGLEQGYMTTVHAYTGDQTVLDRNHKDLYRARASGLSMIPTSTGAAEAVGLVLPSLKGKIAGSAVRVPTPNVSMVDLSFIPGRSTNAEEVNTAVAEASRGAMKGILEYTDEPLVSSDLNHTTASSVFARPLTHVVDGRLVRVLSWYDNEWGFSCRMIDVASLMGTLLQKTR